MNWGCEQTEERLSDYLDGLLLADEQTAFNRHVNTCERCAPLVAAVARTLGGLYALEPVEPSPYLVTAIVTATVGASDWRSLKYWLRTLQSPRFVYSLASVAATLIILLTASGFSFTKPRLAELKPDRIYRNTNTNVHQAYARTVKFVSDLRVVYEIQTRLNENEQPSPTQDESLPQSAPQKQPGRTDNANPSAPKQQNRADEVGRNVRVFAVQLPVLNVAMCRRRTP